MSMRSPAPSLGKVEFLVLLWTTFAAFAALYGPQPLLPVIQQHFGVGSQSASLLMTLAILPLGLAPVCYGYILNLCSTRRLLQLTTALCALVLLAASFTTAFWQLLAQHAHNMERAALTLAPATQQCLLAYDWPGNVRELSNEMERAAALTVDTVIRPSDLSPKLLAALARHGCIKTSATAPREPLPDIRTTFNLEQAERLLVQRALDACQGNKSRAAELLGITREGLRKKLLRLDKTAHGHDGEEA